MLTGPAKSSEFSSYSTCRLHWSDMSLHLFAVGNSELMFEVWLNADATHIVFRYCPFLCYLVTFLSHQITVLYSCVISYSLLTRTLLLLSLSEYEMHDNIVERILMD